jgi:hypothetical protein
MVVSDQTKDHIRSGARTRIQNLEVWSVGPRLHKPPELFKFYSLFLGQTSALSWSLRSLPRGLWV